MMDESVRWCDAVRTAVIRPLAARRAEITQAIYAHIQETVPDGVSSRDPSYCTGLRMAVDAVVDYSLHGLMHGSGYQEPIPVAALEQARCAARSGVSTTVVLHRYFAGHRRLGQFITEEADRIGLSENAPAMHHLLQLQEVLLERLVTAVEREHARESKQVAGPSEQRRMEIVQKLLRGEHIPPDELVELRYEIYGRWHLGVIAVGPGAQEAVLRVRDGLSCDDILLLRCEQEMALGWLGAQRKIDGAEVERLFLATGLASTSLVIGESRKGLDGCRQTHREAQGALLTLRRPSRFARYGANPLLVSALENETLRVWLQDFLEPLRYRSDGRALMRTLRAYIDAECNRSSAASALKEVRRQAVGDRLATAEELLKRPLGTCLAELDVALYLEELAREEMLDAE